MLEVYEMNGDIYVRLETLYEDCEVLLTYSEARALAVKLLSETQE